MNIPVFKTFPKYRHSKMIFSKLQAWRVFYYGSFDSDHYYQTNQIRSEVY